MTEYQKKLIEKHNAEMEIIAATAKANGISEALLYYAAQFGIIGVPWVVANKKPNGI